MNPDKLRFLVRCIAPNGQQIGWGGANGPGTVYSSTGLGYKAQITAVTVACKPLDIRDAFIARELKLKSQGAGNRVVNGLLQMRYFPARRC